MLSLLQEILIYLENADRAVSANELKKFGEKRVRSVLGRTEKRGLIERQKENGEVKFAISPDGRVYINGFLELIHQEQKWDGKWYLFSFSIPEKQRHIRDKLRRHLKEFGFGLLFQNIWINPKEKIKEIDTLVKKLNIQDKTALFEAAPTDQTIKKLISTAWKIEKIEKNYRDFTQRAKKELPKLAKAGDKKFRVKRLIFDYALALSQDPGLPKEYLPASWPRSEAQEHYKKIRELLY